MCSVRRRNSGPKGFPRKSGREVARTIGLGGFPKGQLEFLLGKTHLICDRDPLYTREFRDTLGAMGVKVLRLPARSSDLNAYAERFVLSLKNECLNRLILFSPMQLRTAVESYVEHYEYERTHQGLANRLVSNEAPANSDAPIQCRQRLGGLLKYYHREAA